MKRIFIYATILILTACSGDKISRDSLSYNRIDIVFDGYGEDYETDGQLHVAITDPEIVQKLNQLKNDSQPNIFAAVKGTSYQIRMNFIETGTNNKLLVNLLKSEGRTTTLIYGTGTIFDGNFKNPEFADYVSEVLLLEQIKAHKGAITQAQYDQLISKEK